MSHILTVEDLHYLDLLARTMSRQLSWADDRGATAELRRPLDHSIADLMGVSLDYDGAWEGTHLEYRCQRLAFRGLLLHHWVEIFGGREFRADRYQHLSQQLSAFGQQLVGGPQ